MVYGVVEVGLPAAATSADEDTVGPGSLRITEIAFNFLDDIRLVGIQRSIKSLKTGSLEFRIEVFFVRPVNRFR